ncbi:MAG: hypothetical protein CVU65_04970 [Deltaproteobacteria bacterium HGW-Deltaproteobacteria-22]|jgi:hypothetical protein|nr:MAG: hypothetical protein CVU65_04970 [Deltaproteobacteria bacterium HGW-Deltaproteobacteria-22]
MKTTLRTLSTLLLSLFFVACAADLQVADPVAADDDAVPRQGVTLLDVQPGFSFTARFVKGDDVIFVQAVRGQRTPEMYQQDPESPRFEIDARVTDRDGRILYLRRGGDSFVDPTWTDDVIWQESLPPATGANRALFEMIAEATDAIEAELLTQGVVVTLLDELSAVRGFARNAPVAYADSLRLVDERILKEGFLGIPEAGGGGSLAGEEADALSLSAGWYYAAVHDKSTALIARHSGVRLHQLNGSGTFAYYDFCNHGTCPAEMSQKCSLIKINRPAWYLPACSTGYAAFSDGGGHNCHDDSRVQMASFIFGASNNGSQWWCNGYDDDTDMSAPPGDLDGSADCSDDAYRGYNHYNMFWYTATNTNSAQQATVNYTVTLAAGATYTFSTCGSTSEDTFLRLKNSSGTQVTYNDDACGLQSTMTYKPTTAGTYTVVSGCYGSATCTARIKISLISGDAAPTTTENTEYLAGYSATNTNSALDTANTITTYLNLVAGTTYTITTCGYASTDTYLRLYNSAGTQVTYNDDACGTQSSMVFTASATGAYRLEAGCYGSGSCSASSIKVSF